MNKTIHIQKRMSQRGITQDMVELVLTHGTIDHDKYVLDRRGASRLLQTLQREAQLVKKILDKGGVTVVSEDNALLTTYNCPHHH